MPDLGDLRPVASHPRKPLTKFLLRVFGPLLALIMMPLLYIVEFSRGAWKDRKFGISVAVRQGHTRAWYIIRNIWDV